MKTIQLSTAQEDIGHFEQVEENPNDELFYGYWSHCVPLELHVITDSCGLMSFEWR